MSKRNQTICDDAGGGCPKRQGISAEYVRFKTGRSIRYALLPLLAWAAAQRHTGVNCAFLRLAGNIAFPVF